ncbi:MAG: AzlD domain-containing protein [Geodermatophilaceae bacterium]|nr:AzlD domain-containing protein [Geodermatophilaceae bacterium]MDQ3465996.1 AzlD domain-containing protein [Actinomycetota bacterium]
MIWAVVLAGSVGCYLLKYLGLAASPALLERPAVRRVVELVPAALLAALVVVQAFTDRQALVLDARAAGVAAAAVALLLRAPFLIVLLVAGGTAALVDALI